MLAFTIIRLMIAVALAYLAFVVWQRTHKDIDSRTIKKGNYVMITDTGFEGKVVEIVKYEDMTLYGVRMGNEILHYKREQIIKRT